jgi:hypothetical protein
VARDDVARRRVSAECRPETAKKLVRGLSEGT